MNNSHHHSASSARPGDEDRRRRENAQLALRRRDVDEITTRDGTQICYKDHDMNGYADDLAAVIEALDLKEATPGTLRDLGATHQDQVNRELLAFIKGS